MKNYEKLGSFYLGRLYNTDRGEVTPEILLYDAKDLTTHAVCVGMTGSGKTGLCITLLEEAGIDGIPVIAIDPKGDLGNLLLTFPDLGYGDFQPWIAEGEALRKGSTVQEYAKLVAELWRKGLSEWDQETSRISRFRNSVDLAIYTPGSKAGIPLNVLRSFNAPSADAVMDEEALNERISATVSGLLSLLGLTFDPIRSREHILLSNILHAAWSQGRNLEIASLIREIQSPPFQSVGVFDLESFFPVKERMDLAMMLNGLLASPGFSIWMQGEPLNIQNLLWTPAGKPRISILSIAHLPDAQRMFFVTLLLNELVAWVRSQPGTTSLRAILYMDEVYGYFPPTANPPSKLPMLTLLKQARAFGLGCLLATQNPVDLDYKGLSNAGTWFLGRLQTERDIARVLDGLEGASAAISVPFDRHEIERILAGLKSRIFLMNNVHEERPVLFHTRWALSYLRGPLTRAQIEILMRDRKMATEDYKVSATPILDVDYTAATAEKIRPVLPPEAKEYFLPVAESVGQGNRLLYRPALLGKGRLHYVSKINGVDLWREESVLATQAEFDKDPWMDAEQLVNVKLDLQHEALPNGSFASLPSGAANAKNYRLWSESLKGRFYRSHSLTIWKCPYLKVTSEQSETERDFRARLSQIAREKRDLAMEKLRKMYAPKLIRLQDKIRRAQQKVDQQKSQYQSQKIQSAISIGATLLGAVLGRKSSTIGRATTAARGVGRAAREKSDIGRAVDSLEVLQQKLAGLEGEFEIEVSRLQDRLNLESFELEEVRINPQKSDIEVTDVVLLWMPWRLDKDGIGEPLHNPIVS